MPGARHISNFSHLKAHEEQLERLGLLAEHYFADDPNTCLLKLRQLAEGMAQSAASQVTPATLAKTFRDELVLQDPNDKSTSLAEAHSRSARRGHPARGKAWAENEYSMNFAPMQDRPRP